MTTRLLIGIDGTGGTFQSDAEYEAEMRGGFVSRMCNGADGKNANVETIYERGPRTLGTASHAIACIVANRVAQLAPFRGGEPYLPQSTGALPLDIQRNESFRMVAKRYPDGIFLCGYSRGAHIAIKVAEMLAGADVPVAAMFLFDAVDKDAYMNSKRVPMNVANVYHAIRTDNNRSRWYFGHTGMGQRLDEKRRLCGLIDEAHIDGTHAALGGLPWCGDHQRLRGQLVYAAASVSTFFIANALHMSPRLASSMSSLAGNLASPQTLSKQDDDKAAKEAYEFMKERTARHGISWEWSAPQPAVAGGGGGRSW